MRWPCTNLTSPFRYTLSARAHSHAHSEIKTHRTIYAALLKWLNFDFYQQGSQSFSYNNSEMQPTVKHMEYHWYDSKSFLYAIQHNISPIVPGWILSVRGRRCPLVMKSLITASWRQLDNGFIVSGSGWRLLRWQEKSWTGLCTETTGLVHRLSCKDEGEHGV